MTPPTVEPWIRARVAPSPNSLAAIVRVGPLSPYLAQMIVEDARRAGFHPFVEIEVVGARAASVPPGVRRLRRRIQLLAGGAVHVVIVSSRIGVPSPPLGPHRDDRHRGKHPA